MITGQGKKDLAWLRQVSSFVSSRIILTANNLGIFDSLEKGEKNALKISRALKTDLRATELLLNSLAAIGLLRKKKDHYSNAPVSSRYLVSGRPDYQGDILRHYDSLWKNWSGLDDVVKSGKPNRAARDHQSFILGMHNIALQRIGGVLKEIDLGGVKSVLDLGGGPGTYSIALAKKNLRVTLFDTPDTVRIAGRLIRASKVGNVRLLSGDFMTDDFGSAYDLIFISQIFHAYSEDDCRAMLKKCVNALNAGGRVVVHEFYLDETRAHPLQGAVFAINMLVNTPGGRTYTPAEMTSWMKAAGLTNLKTKVLDDTVLVSGTKKRP